MTDLNPEIWDNPTLGAAAPNENLDRLEKQQIEDRAAKFEDREPREVVVDNTYPGWTPEVSERTGTVPSNYQTVHFADEQQADIPVDSGPEDETAGGISQPEEDADTSENEGGEESPEEVEQEQGEPVLETGENVTYPVEGNSGEESEETQWK